MSIRPSFARQARVLRRTMALIAMVIGTLGATLPQAMTAPVLGLTAEAFGVTTVDASWALTITLVVSVATTPLIGRLGDAYGARRTLLVLMPVVAAGLLITAVAPTMLWLIAGRAVLGLGGGVFPLAIAAIPHIVPPRVRAGAVGLVTAMFATGIGFGVVISGLLVDHVGIRATAWVPFTIVVAGWMLMLVALPHVPRKSDVHVDARGTLALSLGVVALLFSVTEAPRAPGAPGWVAACAAIGATALWYWLRREGRSPDPLIGTATLRLRAVWATQVTAFLLGAVLLGLFVLVPVFAEASGGRGGGLSATVTTAGLLLLPATVAMLAVGPLSGVLRRRIGTRAPVILGAISALIGAAVLLWAPREIAGILTGTVLLGVGIATASAGLVNVVIDHVDHEHVGAATGLTVVMRQLGGAMGASLIAALLTITTDPRGAFTASFTALTAIAVLAVMSATLIPSRMGAHGRRIRTRAFH